eukprot:3935479-Rhodomonas_salina.5
MRVTGLACRFCLLLIQTQPSSSEHQAHFAEMGLHVLNTRRRQENVEAEVMALEGVEFGAGFLRGTRVLL